MRVGKGGNPDVYHCLACPEYCALNQAECLQKGEEVTTFLLQLAQLGEPSQEQGRSCRGPRRLLKEANSQSAVENSNEAKPSRVVK